MLPLPSKMRLKHALLSANIWDEDFDFVNPRGKTPIDFKISPKALYVLAMKLIKQ